MQVTSDEQTKWRKEYKQTFGVNDRIPQAFNYTFCKIYHKNNFQRHNLKYTI